MALATRDILLAKSPRLVETKTIDGLGQVRIQKLRFSEAAKWRKESTGDGLDELRLVCLCVVDENEQPILSVDDSAELANKDSAPIAELIYQVMVINGFMEEVQIDDALADLEKIPDRLLLCRLADRWNIPQVDTLADSLSDEQLAEWKTVALLDGWFEDSRWRQGAEILTNHLNEAPQSQEGFLTPDQAFNHFFPDA
jgi:hypothetical protein